jgi:hypothetical protein
LTIVAGGTAVLALSGCQWTSPLTTQLKYDPSDGVGVEVGQVQLRNVLVVSGSKDGPGVLVAHGANTGEAAVTVALTVEGSQPVSLTVPAGGAAQLSAPGSPPAALKAVPVAPGDLLDLRVSSASGGNVLVKVPVLYPFEGSPYRTLAPEGFTPEPEPTTDASATPAH